MRWREWLGVGERRWKKAPDEEVQPAKTLWDWLQLLIVPAILVGVTFTWSASQTRSDNKREDRRIAADRAAAEEARQAATLQGYLGEMSGLMLREKLLTSNEGSAVQAVARTVTLTALRRLDGERKAAVVRFLHEAGLLAPCPGCRDVVPPSEGTLVRLRGRTSGVPTSGTPTSQASTSGARTSRVRTSWARTSRKRTSRAPTSVALNSRAPSSGRDPRGADLMGANLAHDLAPTSRRADLHGANLGGANLRAPTSGAPTSRAPTSGARDLEGADLRGANLVGANLVDARLLDPPRAKLAASSQRASISAVTSPI